ncbi:OsmC family protein [Sphingobacterium alkalisoli]|uniref:OsmC family protein n=1 Tax=Sphingobacterium alkalisoli TaxID=1874115 RepID=A0A4U0GXL9_9SPHI|nr:OsmC family protein [Sphingobacterium alkalisoli]TJY63883.1 OsmC family protein [Sphingobacterium alkalisoli]GGH24267.1 hypothetical protein GCM10011418_32050 [Sphingobacterium alkalisoli]
MTKDVIVTIGKEKYTTEINFDKHIIIVDEPEELGGKDRGFSPTPLLLSSLGTCKAMTMRMYADRKNWPLEKVEVRLSSEVKKSEQQQTTFIRCHIIISGDLTLEQKQRIYRIADKCPIHKILTNPIIIESNMI